MFSSRCNQFRRRVRNYVYARAGRWIPPANLSECPRWAIAYLRTSGLAPTLAPSTVWPELMALARSFCRRVQPLDSLGDPKSLFETLGYSIALREKMDLVRPLTMATVDLPPTSHRPVPMSRFLRWPWTEIFSPRGIEELQDEFSSTVAHLVPAFELFSSEQDRVDLLRAMSGRRMVTYIEEDDPIYGAPENGMFGLAKSEDRTRLLVDMRRGNALLLGMREVQWKYQDLLSGLPPEEASMFREKALHLFQAAHLTAFSRATIKTESDLSNFFHFLELPRHFFKFQALRKVLSSEVGLPGPRRWVQPVASTAAMGFTLAPLIAQLVHEECLLPALLKPIHVSYAPKSSPQAALAESLPSKSASDGSAPLVPVREVPSSLLHTVLTPFLDSGELEEAARLLRASDLAVPSSALRVRQPLRSGPADATVVTLQGFDLRDGDIELAVAAAVAKTPGCIPFGFFIYIDDHHVLFEVSDCISGRAYADALLFATCARYLLNGFSVQLRKIRWSSSRPSPSLGYVTEFDVPALRIFAKPGKLGELLAQTEALVREAMWALEAGAPLFVTYALFHSVVSGWVWAVLVRRCLLSVLDRCFAAVAGRGRSDQICVTFGVIRELRLIMALAPAMVGAAPPFLPQLWLSTRPGQVMV